MGAISPLMGIATGGTSLVGGAGAAGTTAGTAADAATKAKGGGGFGDVIMNALDGLQGVQGQANDLAVKAATGDLSDVHDYMIASSQAGLATQFTVAVRDRAVEAFNEIMRMQI